MLVENIKSHTELKLDKHLIRKLDKHLISFKNAYEKLDDLNELRDAYCD